MWGKERPKNSDNRGKFLVEKCVVKVLPTTLGRFGRIPFESPEKMRYFFFLAQIFHLSFPKIWQAYPDINYFSEKYMKRQIIAKSFEAVILKL